MNRSSLLERALASLQHLNTAGQHPQEPNTDNHRITPEEVQLHAEKLEHLAAREQRRLKRAEQSRCKAVEIMIRHVKRAHRLEGQIIGTQCDNIRYAHRHPDSFHVFEQRSVSRLRKLRRKKLDLEAELRDTRALIRGFHDVEKTNKALIERGRERAREEIRLLTRVLARQDGKAGEETDEESDEESDEDTNEAVGEEADEEAAPREGG